MKVTEPLTVPKTTTPAGKVRLEVYGGPHHGRILFIPANTRTFVSIAASLPKGDTFRETRTNPRAYAYLGRVVYERKVAMKGVNAGQEYLAFVEDSQPEQITVDFDNTEVQYVRTRHSY